MLEPQELRPFELKLFILHVLERKNGERNEQLPATHRSSSTNWMAPNSCFGFYSQVFFLNATTCPSCLDSAAIGNQIAEWAKETTPFVWERAWAEAGELSLALSVSYARFSPQGKAGAWNIHNVHWQTHPPPRPSCQRTDREVHEWHFCTMTFAWHSCITVKPIEKRETSPCPCFSLRTRAMFSCVSR